MSVVKIGTKHQITIPDLNRDDQQALAQIKTKINKIQTNPVHSQGLTNEEAELAAKVGLIDPEQMWWWQEDWQKGEREVEENIVKGEISETFQNVGELMNYLEKK